MSSREFKTRRSSIFLGQSQTSLFNRLNAKAIDLLVVVALYFLGKTIWPPLGVLGAATVCGLQDGLGVGQSIGKRIIGLRVIEENAGLACSFQNSFMRNLPFVFGILFTWTPLFWIFLILITLPAIALEIYLLVSLDSGVRVGDVLGNTQVVEYVEGMFPDAAY